MVTRPPSQVDITAAQMEAIKSPARTGGIASNSTWKIIVPFAASGHNAFPYIPISTGRTTNGIIIHAAMTGAITAVFSSLQETVRWNAADDTSP